MSKITERVWFTVIVMPCCSRNVCNLTRLPNYCPECGTNIMTKVRECIVVSDYNAILQYTYHD